MKYAATETPEGVFNMRQSDTDVESLTRLIKDMNCDNLRVVEIGTYAGQSAQIFLDTGLVSEIYCIDPWDKDDVTHTDMRIVEESFDARLGHDHRVHKLKGKLEDHADVFFASQPIDFVYIDAENDYEFIRDTINEIRRVINPRIAIGGHDYGIIEGVREAVDFVCGRTPDAIYEDSSWVTYANSRCSVIRFGNGRMGNQLCAVLQAYKKSLAEKGHCYRFECALDDTYREMCALGMRHLVLPPHTSDGSMASAKHIDQERHLQDFGTDFTKEELQGFIRKYIIGSPAIKQAEAVNVDAFGDTSSDEIAAIHMRESDYNTLIYRPFDRADYLKRGLKLLPSACKKIVIFTEDVDAAKKDFEESVGCLADKYEIVYVTPGIPEYDLMRFALFRNKIILNSSFAVWAGMVGNVVYPGSEKCVISPDVCWRSCWDRHYFDPDWNFIMTVSRRGRMPNIIHMLWIGESLPVFAKSAIRGYRDANPGFDVRLTHYRSIADGILHDPDFETCVNIYDCVRTGKDYSSDDAELKSVYDWMRVRFKDVYAKAWGDERIELLRTAETKDLPEWSMVCLAECYRLFMLRKFGGIYVELDTYPLRGFDEHLMRQGDARDGDTHFLLGSVPGVNLLCWYNEEANEQPVGEFDSKLLDAFLRGDEITYKSNPAAWGYVMHAGAGAWKK